MLYNPRVTSEELSRLSEKASVSPAATELLKVFLANNPTPKMKDIRKVRTAIEEEATMRTSKEIVGSSSLENGPAEKLLAKLLLEKQEKTQQAAEQTAFDQHVTSTSFRNLPLEDQARALMTTYFPTVVKVGLGLVVLCLVTSLPFIMRSRRGF